MENNLDIYRFEYFSKSYSPLGRIGQEQLREQVMCNLVSQLSNPAELAFAKKLIDQYFSYLRLSAQPQIIVSNSTKYDELLSQIAHVFNKRNLFFHLAADSTQVIPTNDDKTYNLLPEQFAVLGDLPYISCVIFGPAFTVSDQDLTSLLTKLNRDGHFFSIAENTLSIKRLGQAKSILGSSEQAQALEADFKARLSELASLEPAAKLAAILILEADYFRQSDYLNEAGHDLIVEINQVKNQTLSDLTQEVEFDAK
ncbi:MAG: hypothetical protein SOY59_01180 [Ligilactobacillus agilis]|nr:hypothetical protein [Ligilactobacillus agilis]